MSRLTIASFACIASIVLMLASSNADAGPTPCVSQPQSTADEAIGNWVEATLFDAARQKHTWGTVEAAAATTQQRKSDLATIRETAHETLARFGALSKQQQAEVLAAAAPALQKLKPESERDEEYLHAIQFNGSSLGWAMDWNGRFHRTSDGGATWTDTRLADAGLPGLLALEEGMFRSMHFADDQFGLIVGPAGILETQDGGENWETSPLAYFHVPDAVFCDAARTCWIAGEEPNAVYRREISQWAWSPQSTPATGPINAIQFIGSNGWAVSLGGEIIGTTDAGENWTLLFRDASKVFRAVDFVDQRTGWAVGDEALIMRTDDGGKNWRPQRIQLPPNFPVGQVRLNAVRFADSLRGWAAGLHGMIFATTDGGACWNLQRFEGIPQNWLTIYSLAITAGPTVWASGNSGHIFVSTDNGKFWFPVHGMAVPVFEELRRVMDRIAK